MRRQDLFKSTPDALNSSSTSFATFKSSWSSFWRSAVIASSSIQQPLLGCFRKMNIKFSAKTLLAFTPWTFMLASTSKRSLLGEPFKERTRLEYVTRLGLSPLSNIDSNKSAAFLAIGPGLALGHFAKGQTNCMKGDAKGKVWNNKRQGKGTLSFAPSLAFRIVACFCHGSWHKHW